MTQVFNELDYRLSVVPRWTILSTIQKQSVAEHCFNVERIARQIAEHWFMIIGVADLALISQLALHHDDDEALTSDIPSTAKRDLFSEKYLDKHRALWYNRDTMERRIVKLADYMESFWFLSMEVAMGNKYITEHRNAIGLQMLEYAKEFGEEVVHRLHSWAVTTKEMRSQRYD